MPKQVYHHYTKCEEFHPNGGMWKKAASVDAASHAEKSTALMASPTMFEQAMARVLDEWPNSVEAALTDPAINQRAWMGQAGCYLATGSPEACTRSGWWHLDAAQQQAANAAAGRVIAVWCAARSAAAAGAQLELDLEGLDRA